MSLQNTGTGRKDVEVAASAPLQSAYTTPLTYTLPVTPPLVWQGETRLAVPSANPAGARPVPLDPLDRILVQAVVAG